MNQSFIIKSAPDSKKESKYSKDFEFLFFFLEAEKLATSRVYQKSYVDYLEKNFKVELRTGQKGRFDKNYWFYPDVSPCFFSKVFIFDLLKDILLFEHEVFTVESPKDLLKINPLKEYILKKDIGFSGKGIENFKDKEQCKDYPFIVEEKLDRAFDFSMSYFEGRKFFYENIVDENYQYKGTVIDKSILRTGDDFLLQKGLNKKRVSLFLKSLDKIIEVFLKNKLINFNIDFFVYTTTEGLKIHPFCEVNPRRTMGGCFLRIFQKYFSDKKRMLFDIILKENFKNEALLSPSDNKMFLVRHRELNDL